MLSEVRDAIKMIKGTGRAWDKGKEDLHLLSQDRRNMVPKVIGQLSPTAPTRSAKVWAVEGLPGALPELSFVSPRPPVFAHNCGPGTEGRDLGCTPAGPGCLLEKKP